MKVYFNGLELIALAIAALGGLFILICYLLDRWCNRHWGSKGQKWIYKHLLKK